MSVIEFPDTKHAEAEIAVAGWRRKSHNGGNGIPGDFFKWRSRSETLPSWPTSLPA